MFLFNQCRLEWYLERHLKSDHREEYESDLSTLEKQLLHSHDLCTVRGKHGSPVPVLIPPDAQPAMEYIADAQVRKNVEVDVTDDEGRHFLFSNKGILTKTSVCNTCVR